jgi:hypothetical protein
MRHRVFHHVKDFPVGKSGDIEFEILLNGKRRAAHRLTIKNVDDGP